jgi:hypothetical protein
LTKSSEFERTSNFRSSGGVVGSEAIRESEKFGHSGLLADSKSLVESPAISGSSHFAESVGGFGSTRFELTHGLNGSQAGASEGIRKAEVSMTQRDSRCRLCFQQAPPLQTQGRHTNMDDSSRS